MSDKGNLSKNTASTVDLMAEMNRIMQAQAQRQAEQSATKVVTQALDQARQVLSLPI